MSAARRDIVGLIIVALVPIVANSPILFGGVAADPALVNAGFSAQLDWNGAYGYPTIDPNIGFISQALGRGIATALAHGHILWWNPFEGIGNPIGESLSAAGMFPFSLLLALNNGVAIERCALEITAGLATWFLIRELGGSTLAAVLGGAVFAINGTAAWLATPWANTAPFLPLLVLGVERLRRSAFGGWALVAIAIGLSILAGFPEIAYLYGLLAVGWACVRIWQSPERIQFALALVTSGFAGILVAAPALVAFLDYLGVGYTGGHLGGGFADVSLGADGIPQVLLPYVWGPIFAGHGPLWSNVGGYAGVGLCTLAIVALFGQSDRAIRIFLFGWTVVTIAATYNAPIAHDIFVRLPLVKYTAYFRFLPTSWEFALAILAAFAVDDIRAFTFRTAQWRVGFGIVICCVAVGFSLLAAQINLLGAPGAPFRSWIFHSLEAAIVVFIGIAAAATIERARLRAVLVGLVIVTESVGYYVIPEQSFPRSGTLDMAPVVYLQKHLGFQRFYTLGPIAPNYGTYFGIASINHNDLPVPNAWIAYIRKNLDPFADIIAFVGYSPFPGIGVPSRAEELRANIHGFEGAGVRFVVSRSDQDPFSPAFESSIGPGPQTITELKNSTTIRYDVNGVIAPGTLTAIDVLQSNDDGTADGTLNVRVCDSAGTCATGSRAMRESSDSSFFRISIHQPIQLKPPTLTVTLTNLTSTHPTAFLTYPSAAQSSALSVDGRPASAQALRLRFEFTYEHALARRVFADQTIAIFELPHPRPYLDAPGCTISTTDRTMMAAVCQAPSTLHRLELMLPGWHAEVNGKPTDITPFDEAFQSIPLAAGHSSIRFWFLPPYEEYGFAGFILAMIAIAVSLVADRRHAGRRSMRLAGTPQTATASVRSAQP